MRRRAKERAKKLSKQSKIFLLKNKGRLVALAILALFILIFCLIYQGLAYLFSDFGALLLTVGSFFLLLRLIATAATFPGSFWFVRRQVQVEFNHDYASRLSLSLDRLQKCLQNMPTPNNTSSQNNQKNRLRFSRLQMLIGAIRSSRQLLTEHVHVFRRMAECDKITAR